MLTGVTGMDTCSPRVCVDYGWWYQIQQGAPRTRDYGAYSSLTPDFGPNSPMWFLHMAKLRPPPQRRLEPSSVACKNVVCVRARAVMLVRVMRNIGVDGGGW